MLALAVCAQTAARAQRSVVDTQPPRMQQIQRTVVPNKKEISIEDLFPKTEIPYVYPNPVALTGQTVGGLNEKNSATLGTNLFVVVDNTKYNTFAELYKGNRLKGKSNFVTVDALMHSFVCVRNGILANAIEAHGYMDLAALIAQMLKETSEDYKEADDAEVRNDLEKNLAFLNVASKLLDPNTPSVQLGSAAGLATKELTNIRSGQRRHSAIYGVEEDFSQYRPCGWYNSSQRLQNFYKAKTWLSRVSFLLSENTSNDGTGDSFRRSALLYRSLDKSVVGQTPGLQVWQRVNALVGQLGPPVPTDIKTLTPADYKEVFKPSNGDLKMSLQGLSEPFYRTKLLLSVRRQRPTQISSTSIFDLEKSHPERATQACFRIFPVVDQPEFDWLRQQAHNFQKENYETPPPPLALLDLHSHGIPHATNVLADNVWKLDPSLTNVVPQLVQWMKRAIPQDTVWLVLGNYFKMPVDALPAVYKTNTWMTHKLLSGYGAWLDSQVGFAPPVPKVNEEDEPFPVIAPPKGSATAAAIAANAAKPATSANSNTASAAAAATSAETPNASAGSTSTPVKVVRHYLEPCPDVYKNMRFEMTRMNSQLQSIGYATGKYAPRVEELTTCLQRLEGIAQRGLNGLPPAPADSAFLGEIDKSLEKISPPTVASLFLDTGAVNEQQPTGSTANGASMVLGHPAMVFMLFQSGRTLTVARGGAYSYHELPGSVNMDHLERKMEFGFLSPPTWAESFQVVQDQPAIGGN